MGLAWPSTMALVARVVESPTMATSSSAQSSTPSIAPFKPSERSCLVVSDFAPPSAPPALALPRKPAFYQTHTGESLNAPYWKNGIYDTRALGELDYILRVFVIGEEMALGRRLLALLVDLHRRLGSHAP